MAACGQLHGDGEADRVFGQFCKGSRDDNFGFRLILLSPEDDRKIQSCGIEILRGGGA